MATSELKVALNNFIKQVQAGRSSSDPVRNLLNQRTQAYIVNPRVILKEILRPESPYKIQLDRGIITPSQIRGIAREISFEFWKELKITSSKFKTYKLTGIKFPPEFLNNSSHVVGLDDRKRIIYWRGQSGDFYESFRANIVKPTIDRVKAGSRDPMDSLRVYVSPDEKYMAELNKVDQEVNAQAEREGILGTKAAEGRRARARKKYIKEQGLPEKAWQGLDIGHVFGAKASGAAGLLANPHDVAHHLNNLTLAANLSDLEPELSDIINYVIRTDIEAVWERVYRNDEVAGKLTLLIPESFVNNRFTGGTAGQRAQKALNAIVKDLGNNLHRLQGSPSYQQIIQEIIEKTFLNKKVGNKRYNTRAKTSFSEQGKIAVHNIPSKRVKIKAKQQNNKAAGSEINTDMNSLITYLNNRLHDKIQDNMGKGGAKQVLNYRTGRFAKSAKIQSFFPINEKNAIGARVKYMRYPYGVFEPGGRLFKPGRDPHRIFGKSIRQLLQEEKIANLRRVKVDLSGG